MSTTVKARFHYLILTLGVYLADQVTKRLAEALREHPSVPLIPDFFHLTYVENAGIAWGLFADAGHGGRLVLSLISLIAATGIAIYALRTPVNEKLTHWGLALVLGGVLGNLTDRLFRGAVVDFLDFTIGEFKWPTFNIADAAISIGALILIADALRSSGSSLESQVNTDENR
ncbi:MAG TPA: signal peptidase II [Blastocatellia bacterium]|nr:signal peptidase II [Blastocatellia bacterium]